MAKKYEVTFKKSGITVEVAEDARLHLPYDYRSGTCTTCMQK